MFLIQENDDSIIQANVGLPEIIAVVVSWYVDTPVIPFTDKYCICCLVVFTEPFLWPVNN